MIDPDKIRLIKSGDSVWFMKLRFSNNQTRIISMIKPKKCKIINVKTVSDNYRGPYLVWECEDNIKFYPELDNLHDLFSSEEDAIEEWNKRIRLAEDYVRQNFEKTIKRITSKIIKS